MSLEMEAVERAALADLHAAVPESLRAELGISRAEIGGAFVSAASALPSSAIVINRAIGLGLASPESRDSVEAIAAAYARAGIERYFVHLHPESEPDTLAGWLGEAGLEAARGWMKFRRGREAPPEARTDLEIRPAVPADAEALGRIVADAFDLGPGAAPWIGRLIGRPGWHVYMSFDGETPAGTGSMFVQDGIAYLDWGATAPSFRGRGAQSAVLARRIADALDLGCRLLVTATGEDVPGDPQHSYKNILRAGFEPAYIRKNYAPPRKI